MKTENEVRTAVILANAEAWVAARKAEGWQREDFVNGLGEIMGILKAKQLRLLDVVTYKNRFPYGDMTVVAIKDGWLHLKRPYITHNAEDADGLANLKFEVGVEDLAFSFEDKMEFQLVRREKDDCSVCKGDKGGVRGNENLIDGKLICDYCISAMDKVRLQR